MLRHSFFSVLHIVTILFSQAPCKGFLANQQPHCKRLRPQSFPSWERFVRAFKDSRCKDGLVGSFTAGVLQSSDSSVNNMDVDIIEGPYEPAQLKDHWGVKPLLIRNAFDLDDESVREAWPSMEDIISLSCYSDDDDDDDEDDDGEWDEDEPGHSSRLVQHVPGQMDSFELELGPFDREYLDEVMKNKEKKWTLLLNDVGRYMPECQHWMNSDFAFAPRWRRDDAQVSVAGDGGGIGPHVDNYDVFLLQTSGDRIWEIDPTTLLPVSEEYDTLVPDIPVRILKQSPQQKEKLVKLLLKPGDMLYLPPRIIHCGTAAEEESDGICMTLSVGFRAPAANDLVARVAETLQDSVRESAVQRYCDSGLVRDHLARDIEIDSPSISEKVRNDMKNLVRAAVIDLMDDDSAWDKLIGGIVTEATRYSEIAVLPYHEIEDELFLQTFGKNPEQVLSKVIENDDYYLIGCEGISFATSFVMEGESTRVDRLYAHGAMWEVRDSHVAAKVFNIIERGLTLNSTLLQNLGAKSSNKTDSLFQILKSLITDGILRPCVETS